MSIITVKENISSIGFELNTDGYNGYNVKSNNENLKICNVTVN